jgi:glutathione transport system permease protein
VPYDAESFFDYDKLNARPSREHWFGVDALGRDIFSRILMGARISLAAGFVSVAIGALIGTVLGLLAGYFEGWWDRVIMRICDVLFAFPGILLAIGVVAILGGGMINVIFAVAIFSIPTFARTRAGHRALAQAPHVRRGGTQPRRHRCDARVAAHLPGHRFGRHRVLLAAHRDVDHHRGQPLLPRHGRAAADAGVGRDARRRALGDADRAARGDLPALAIFLTVLAFNLLGDGLRDALDPRLERR